MIAEKNWEPVTRQVALEAWWEDERRMGSWAAFVQRRAPIINAIPLDATWWRVSPLSWYDLREVHVIASHGVGGRTSLFDLCELCEDRRSLTPSPFGSPPETWRGILLFGHSRLGPFSILEGNHRLLDAAYAGPRARPLALQVHVAISERDCQWHAPVGP
jgi:hypothetical protein